MTENPNKSLLTLELILAGKTKHISNFCSGCEISLLVLTNGLLFDPHVADSPMVTAWHSYTHDKRNMSLELVCSVTSNPPAKVNQL